MAAAKISGIYEIVNTLNGKRYVGSAVDLRLRRNQHVTRLRNGRHHSRYLQKAWDKYGEGAFEFRIILRCDRDDLLMEEQKQIDLKSDYNMTKGAGSCLGRTLSDETRAKIAAAHLGRKHGPRSEEHRRNISAALKGKKKPAHVMEALQSARLSYKFTEEDKASRSAGMKRAYDEGRKSREKSAAHRERIAETLREKSADEEVRARLSAQASAAWGCVTQEERAERMAKVRSFRRG